MQKEIQQNKRNLKDNIAPIKWGVNGIVKELNKLSMKMN